MVDNPCYKCKERNEFCHCACPKYDERTKERDKRYKDSYKMHELESFMSYNERHNRFARATRADNKRKNRR